MTTRTKIKHNAMASEKINICVFGASSRNIEASYLDAAYHLGKLMAQRGWTCLNGAGSEGLMRAVSDGVLDAGGEAVGVIPQFMIDNGWHYDRLTRIIATATMHERKHTLATLGYYDHLEAMLNHSIEQGFMKASHHRLWRMASSPAEAIDILEQELSHEAEPTEPKY